jgi:hypothetical protein
MSQDTPDFNAAMIEDPPDFATILKPKKRGRKPKPKPQPDSPSILNNKYYIDANLMKDENPDILDSSKGVNMVNIKEKLTNQELTFLEILFNTPRVKGKDRITIDKAMISAGYGEYSQKWRYLLASKIVGKYEAATPEAENILQALGFGKVRAAQELIDKVETAKSEQVSLNALALAIKMHRMIEEIEDKMQGIQINIITQPAAPGPDAPPSGPAVVIQGQPAPDAPATRKPLQISR